MSIEYLEKVRLLDMGESELIGNAFRVAMLIHMDQKRKWEDNSPYLIHPVRCARLIALRDDCDASDEAIMLLHDTIEDVGSDDDTLEIRDVKREKVKKTIESLCGSRVFNGVMELTNPSCRLPKMAPRNQKKELDFAHIRGISTGGKQKKMIDRMDNLMYGFPPSNFMRKYLPESLELAEICKDADPALYNELVDVINWRCNQSGND